MRVVARFGVGVDNIAVDTATARAIPVTYVPDYCVAEVAEHALDGREDFTGDVVVTIDPADARDFDDAVSLVRDGERGHWQLTVHIADVSDRERMSELPDEVASHHGGCQILVEALKQKYPALGADASDTDHFAGCVDDLVARQQHLAVIAQRIDVHA